MSHVTVTAVLHGRRVTFRDEQDMFATEAIATSDALMDAVRAYVGQDCGGTCDIHLDFPNDEPLADWERELLARENDPP